MRNRLLLGFVLFALIAMALLVIPIGFTLEAHDNASTLTALRRDTNALSTLLANDLSHNRVSQATRLSNSYARTTGRQVLVLAKGQTLIASKGAQALDDTLTKIGLSVGTLQKAGVIPRTPVEGPQYYVAMRLPHATNPDKSIDQVVLIVTYPVTVVANTIHSDWRNLGIYGALMLAAAVMLGFLISNSLTRPLRRISAAVDEIGSGQLGVRAPVDEGPPELRRLAEAINSTSARLINLLEAQKAFVEDASHQLRTPLTALQLHLENIQHGEQGVVAEDFNSVLAELGRLNHLVDSLLALARNESRNPILEVVNLSDVAEERVTYWKPFAEEHDLNLEVSTSPDLGVFAISGVLEQVLDNLLSNAFDATPAGGHIRVEAFDGGDTTIELHVIDDGPGLEPGERELALRRFWRGRDNASEGSGLGLAIVDQLVRLSGGSIELRAVDGRGIDATVLLRRA
jgi:signal transduction histidine kinase